MYNRLDTIPACDRWTDRQTDILRRHSLRYAYASRGNKHYPVDLDLWLFNCASFPYVVLHGWNTATNFEDAMTIHSSVVHFVSDFSATSVSSQSISVKKLRCICCIVYYHYQYALQPCDLVSVSSANCNMGQTAVNSHHLVTFYLS